MEFVIWPVMLATAYQYVLSLSFVYHSLFERRFNKFVHWMCLLAAILLISSSLFVIPAGTSLLRVVSYLIANILILSLFRGRLLARLCISILFYFIAIALETISLPIILILAKVSVNQIWEKPIWGIIIYTFPMASLSISSLFLAQIIRRWKNQIELPGLEWLAIFSLALFTFFEMYCASILISRNSTIMPLLPILGFVLVFMNVGLLLLLDKLAYHHKMAQENLALQEQMRYNRLSMQAAAESYEIQRSLTHDFDNHLLTIVQLLQSEQYKDACLYAQAVMGSVSKADVAVNTNNPIADAVLNQKYRKAQERHIQMQFLVSDLASFPLSTDEMVTVLANLLDNAIEACVGDGATRKKKIRVKLLMEPALATLSVQNTSTPVMISPNGEVATTKKNQSEHGYGMKVCKKILNRAGFEFAVQYKDGWFQSTAIKPL